MAGIDLGPQVDGERGFIAQMRRHQSWWREVRLDVRYGNGPSSTGPLSGSCLRPEDAAKGSNFLTDEVHEVAKKRLGDQDYRCFHNLLSSQPMCFNLFGPLVPKATESWRRS